MTSTKDKTDYDVLMRAMAEALEMAWELADCASVAAQEGDGASTVDAAKAGARRDAILEHFDALLLQVKHAQSQDAKP